MNPKLKRIEQTLDRLAQPESSEVKDLQLPQFSAFMATGQGPGGSPGSPGSASPGAGPFVPPRALSFELEPCKSSQAQPSGAAAIAPTEAVQPSARQTTAARNVSPEAAAPSSLQGLAGTSPGESSPIGLPRVPMANFTSHRNAANPALALNLLKEIETLVTGWQTELHQLIRQIQDLYLEGPIVDGWLEAYSPSDRPEPINPAAPAFRHAEMDCLQNYVEQLAGQLPAVETNPEKLPTVQPPGQLNPSGYRLCGLNETGQLWFRHCPPDQIPSISLAIVRYQRLEQMLSRKNQLEHQLGQLSQTLIGVHGQLPR